MDQAIQNFVESRQIAVVGASQTRENFGVSAGKELLERGYEVVYVHPEAAEINGHPAYPDLTAVKDQVEAVWIGIPPEKCEPVLREAAEVGLTRVWLQQGASSPELEALAQELGLEIVSGKCILMYAEPVQGFHKFHQVIWKLVGQY